MSAKEADLSEFEALVKQGCKMADVLEAVGAERNKLEAALEASHIPTTAIVKWLKVRNVEVGHSTVLRHRHGNCSC